MKRSRKNITRHPFQMSDWKTPKIAFPSICPQTPYETHAFGTRNVPLHLLSNSGRILQNLFTALGSINWYCSATSILHTIYCHQLFMYVWLVCTTVWRLHTECSWVEQKFDLHPEKHWKAELCNHPFWNLFPDSV